MTHYHVGNNLPGCLPTGDTPEPPIENFETARDVLIADLRAAEESLSNSEYDDDNAAELDALAEAVATWKPSDDTGDYAAGRYWWIETCDAAECEGGRVIREPFTARCEECPWEGTPQATVQVATAESRGHAILHPGHATYVKVTG